MRSVFSVRQTTECCLRLFFGGLILSLLIAPGSVADQPSLDLKKGNEIYNKQCARCHGKNGGGSSHFEDKLEGDLSIDELAEYISDTMPEEDPDLCVDKDAKAVAEFVFASFYSEAARNRRSGARVELQRRTVRQYRQSLAELVGSFQPGALWIPEERGLTADYFAWGHHKEERRLSQQTDAKIDFPESTGGVEHFRADNNYEDVKEIKRNNNMGKGFSIYWWGGVIAPRTGEYEILVNCRNGFKLFLNNKKIPLIDRYVRSDDALEHKAKIFLIEGRPYYFHMNLFSYRDPQVSAQVMWKPPRESFSVIPESAFIHQQPEEVIVVSTPFPADDASRGYERGSSVSRQWDEATTDAAIEAAVWISDRIEKLAKAKKTDDKRKEKVIQFCHRFVERAFVSRLSDDEKKFFVDQQFENDLSIKDQVKRVVLLTLKSPRFLYPELAERDRNLELAERIALVLWDSLPDAQLMKQAKKGKLQKDEILHGEMWRLLHDPRSKSKLKNFFAKWLKLDHISETTKDAEAFPDFDEELLRDLRRSLERQLEEFAWSQDAADYRQLYLSDDLFVNNRIAQFYEVETDAELDEGSFAKVEFEPQTRAGLLTHPYLLAGLAYHKDSSPIHRGVFVARSLIGRRLRQPPDDVEPLTEEFGKEMTTRERVEHQTKETACMNCHRVINPLGFSLENFDAVGKFRAKEKDKPIDVSTIYETPNGKQVELNGPRDLAKFLAQDEMAQRSFIRHLFHHYTKQSINAYGEETLDRLHRRFVDQDYNIHNLLIEIVKVVIE